MNIRSRVLTGTIVVSSFVFRPENIHAQAAVEPLAGASIHRANPTVVTRNTGPRISVQEQFAQALQQIDGISDLPIARELTGRVWAQIDASQRSVTPSATLRRIEIDDIMRQGIELHIQAADRREPTIIENPIVRDAFGIYLTNARNELRTEYMINDGFQPNTQGTESHLFIYTFRFNGQRYEITTPGERIDTYSQLRRAVVERTDLHLRVDGITSPIGTLESQLNYPNFQRALVGSTDGRYEDRGINWIQTQL